MTDYHLNLADCTDEDFEAFIEEMPLHVMLDFAAELKDLHDTTSHYGPKLVTKILERMKFLIEERTPDGLAELLKARALADQLVSDVEDDEEIFALPENETIQ